MRENQNSAGGFREQVRLGLPDRLPDGLPGGLRHGLDVGPASAEPAIRETEPLGRHHGMPQNPYALGHRDQLRQRFLEAGPSAVADHEMLELVLFRAVPEREVTPLAMRLLATFGDFNGAISASPARLAGVQGASLAVVRELKLVEAAAHRLARVRVMHRPALSGWPELMTYCKTVMAHRETEQFRILFLDKRNVLIADEVAARGTVDHVPVYPREVVKRALELNASALILVHNHPSGDPTPSAADIDMTLRVNRALKAVGIVLHDHVIIGRESDTSFRSRNLI